MGQAGLNRRLQRALAGIVLPETEQLLADMIAIESHGDAPEGEARMAVFIAGWLRERGIEAWLEEALPGRPNVVAKLEGAKRGASLVLNGHTDTVPAYGMKDPFRATLRDGKLYGRGSVDMKGALAAMLTAMAAVRRSGGLAEGTLFFAGTVGEETFSPGAHHLSRSGFRADYAIVGEPTELQVGIAHKGVAWFEAEFEGVAAHGSVPEQGVNAISSASRWIADLDGRYIPGLRDRSHPILGSPSLNVGVIKGGTRPVIVPAHCLVQFERRLIPGETAETTLSELQQSVRQAGEGRPGFKGEVRIADNFFGVPHGPLETDAESRLVRSLTAACAAERELPESAPVGLQFWTDGALLQQCCKETVVCGPGGIAQAHSDDEYIEVGQLHAAVGIYVRAALSLCEGQA